MGHPPARRAAMRTQHTVAHAAHPVDELTWVTEGRVVLRIGNDTLIATPHRAIYVPAGLAHRVDQVANTAVRPLFISAVHLLGERPLTLPRTEALNRLAEPLVTPGESHTLGPAMAGLMDALVPWVRSAAPALPQEPRARRIAQHILVAPGQPVTLSGLAASEGISARTVQRVFLRETGLSFSQWRTRCRLSAGADRLRDGASVTEAAEACGYTPSTFIARYREEFGITPGRDAQHLRRPPDEMVSRCSVINMRRPGAA